MIIEVDHITKTYGDVTAVEDVSFTLKAGEIVGLLGPNGAGKTTTILMLLGLIAPTSGSIRIFGRSFDRDRDAILAGMNFCAPYVSFPRRLSVFENLMVFAHLYQVSRPRQKVMELLRQFDLESMSNRPVLQLSSGQNTRVALCKAVLNAPRVLLLDEPMAYLDPKAAAAVKDVLRNLSEKQGTAVLYSTHNTIEAEEMCKQIMFLFRGRVVARGSPIEVTQASLGRERGAPALKEVFLRLAEPVK
jgi:ABC-2 type transport system ATP-binding protein